MKTQTPHTKLLLAGAALMALVATPFAHADYSSTVLTQAPLGYWRLNETTQPINATTTFNFGSLGSSAAGTYNGSSGGGQTGPFAGSTAVSLDGGSKSVTTPYQAALNPSSFTIEAWVNPVSATVSGGLLCVASSMHSGATGSANRSGWLIYQSDGSALGAAGVGYYLRIYAQNGAAINIQLLAPQTVVPGTWTHLVFTLNGLAATAYINGAQVSSASATAYVPNTDSPFSVGTRSDNAFSWPGRIAEVAYYNTALSGASVSAHYTAGTGAPGTYSTTVLADNPILYWRFAEASQPPAANLGTRGSAGDGYYVYDTTAGSQGPVPPTFPGFDAANKAPTFHGTTGGGGTVQLPALNLNTNSVTISCWVNPNGAQANSAGLVVCGPAGSDSGLTMDYLGNGGGYGLGVIWGGSTFGWSPVVDSGLPALPDSTWSFAALVIQPTLATLYICDANNFGNWATASYIGLNNGLQSFSAVTVIGGQTGQSPLANRSFNGSIDEVTIFNRSLGQGELYSEYATAIGGVPPRIFTDLQGPSSPVPAGDPIVLTVDAGGTQPLTYTWHRSGTNFASTSSGTLTTLASASDLGTLNYDVTISGTGTPAQSQTVPVTVIIPSQPVIVGTQGFFNRTLYPTGTLAIAVSATGGGLKYQWYRNASPIASATGSAYIVPNVTTANAGNYSVSVTNSVGHATNGPVAITIPTPTPGSYAALVVASGPEAWWRLDEASGTNLLDGVGRHDGYYTNANGSGPLPTLGAAGIATGGDTAVSFSANGGIGYVPFSPNLNNSAGYTYEAWVKTTALGAFQVPFSSVDGNGGVWFAMVTGTTPVTWEPGTSAGYVDMWNSSDPTPHSFSTLPTASGVWTHLIITYDPTIIINGSHFPWKFYVNGVTDANYYWTIANNAVNSSAPFIIGCAASPAPLAGSFFNGQVDEIAVYKRVLGATEITNHFSAGFPATPPSFSTPFLPQTVTAGKSVSFSTTVQGSTPITLQWYKGSTPISGQTSNTFAIASTVVSDTATYTLWATNSAGVASQSVSLTVIPQTAYANVTNNLVLHLRFDGNTTDTSGHGNNGTAVGGPTFVGGIIGAQALNYTTTTVTNNTPVSNVTATAENYVTLGTPTDLQFGSATSWSVSLWVKLPAGSSSGDLPFIGTGVGSMNNPGWDLGPTYGGGGWQWCLNDGVTVQPATNNVDINGAAGSINDGNWHNFVLVVDRSAHAANTYLDGIFLGSAGISALSSVDNGQAVVIGQDPTGTYPQIPSGASQNDLNVWGTSPSATLDDIGIWRRALSALEVAQIQSAGSTAGHSFDTVPTTVTLTITRSGSNLILGWTSGTLLQSDNVGPTASWSPVPGASAPSFTVTPTATKKFYRVQVQ